MNTTTKQRKRRPSMAGVMSRLAAVEQMQVENSMGFTKRMMDFEDTIEKMRGRLNRIIDALDYATQMARTPLKKTSRKKAKR